MNAFVLHDLDDRTAMARWSASAALIIAAHAALLALGASWYAHAPPAGVALPTIMIDLAPAPPPAAPGVQPLDLTPRPEMHEVDPPPPEPLPPEPVQERSTPPPPQQNPVVEASPEQKVEAAPPKPEPAKAVPEQPKPAAVKPKPVRLESRKPVDAPPAPRT